MAGRDEDVFVGPALVGSLQGAFVRDGERLLVEERLAGLSASPVLFGVPGLALIGEVVVGLDLVGRVVARLVHQCGNRIQPIRHGDRLVLAMVLSADAGTVTAGRQHRPRGRADGTVGEGVGEDDPLASHRGDAGSFGAVGVEEVEVVLGVVLRYQPDNVGPVGRRSLGCSGESPGRHCRHDASACVSQEFSSGYHGRSPLQRARLQTGCQVSPQDCIQCAIVTANSEQKEAMASMIRNSFRAFPSSCWLGCW